MSASPPDPEFAGPYRLLRPIGEGATGRVFAAESPEGERVAVKLQTRVEDDASAPDRDALAEAFAREADALRGLVHPNVARLLDYGSLDDGRRWLALELLEGASIEEIADSRDPVLPAHGVEWMIEAASGLEAAWRRYIVHRDVKPSNLRLDATGRLKVLDFGLAASAHRGDAPRAFLGTPRYMSPEQALGRGTDCRSDIYSLGAVFYRLFAGQTPFEGATSREIADKHVREPLVPAREVEPSLPRELSEILDRMLEKDPEARYRDYAELLVDLRELRLALAASGNLAPEARAAIALASGRGAVGAEDSRAPGRLLLAAFVFGAICLGAAVWATARFEAALGPEPGPGGWITRRLVEIVRLDPRPLPPDREGRDFTLRRMESLARRIRAATHGGVPPWSLDDLAPAGDASLSDATDAWGTPIAYDRASGSLRSAGEDRRFETDDDLTTAIAEPAGDAP